MNADRDLAAEVLAALDELDYAYACALGTQHVRPHGVADAPGHHLAIRKVLHQLKAQGRVRQPHQGAWHRC